MPTYEYRCEVGHLIEHEQSGHEPIPESIACTTPLLRCRCEKHNGAVVADCEAPAHRIFSAPAAIHFHGPGFYATDYKGRYDRKRRKNPGDDLPMPSEAAITRAEGAEYDPPKNLPDVIERTT